MKYIIIGFVILNLLSGEEKMTETREIKGSFVCKMPCDNEFDMGEIVKIAEHTKNTWQTNRTLDEICKDTLQGKRAELILENIIDEKSNVKFISYDSFRKDEYRKHAPFDGLIVSEDISEASVNKKIERINRDIEKGGERGTITTTLRKELEDSKIFTVEIKSSSLKASDYRGIESQNIRKLRDYGRILDNLKKWDYFVYPHFTRKSNYIKNFYEYSEYVKNNESDVFGGLGNEKFLKKLMRIEFDNASDIHTRVYFDYCTNEIYVPGYVLKEDFFKKPVIGKMPGRKSGEALYYMHPINQGKSFLELGSDMRLRQFNRMNAYEQLLAGRSHSCEKCQSNLNLCRGDKYKKYFYKCYMCGESYNI